MLEPPGAGIMENVMFWEPPGAAIMENVIFGAARRGNDGKRNVFEPPGARIMDNVTLLSRQAQESWKT